jgi:LmbE family N-acetylglucosaminyl deacetylase
MTPRIHPTGYAGLVARRLPLAVLLALVALVAFSASARAAVGEGGECTTAHMYVVAHEDDTLLFQSPSILQDIESGRCIRSVFITAGDAGKGSVYWHSREEGVEAAYAQMAGVEDEWTSSTLVANGHSLSMRTLVGDPQVTAVFIRLPDGGYPAGTGYPMYGNQSLMKLWNGGNGGTPSESTMTAVDGSNTFDYSGLVKTLTALMQGYEPQQIATQDYTETFSGWDHHDHTAAAYFTRLAQRSYTKPHQLLAFQDYPTLERPQNLSGPLLEEKKSVFYLYGLYDEGACSEEIACEATEYNVWLKRQYVTGKETTGVIADAGYAQTVGPGALVKLSGAASSAESGKALAYKWTQTGGPTVTLAGAETAAPTFVAPGSGTATFSLAVRDGVTWSAADKVSVTVEAASAEPVASAGAPQSVSAGSTVQLDGSGSYDPEGGSLSYKWTQTGGPTVALSSTTVAKPTFTAPGSAGELTFALTVSAGGRTSTASTVTVEVVAAPGTANVAPAATATASSEAPEQGAALAIDGVISGYPTNPFAEWSSEGEKAGAWLQLGWSGSYTLDHVVLYDRPNPDDQITSGTLTFSDGSTVAFGSLPNTGSTGLTVSFPARATTSLKVTVTGVSGTTLNVGLSEIEAWGAPTVQNPLAVAGPPQSVASGQVVTLDGSGSSDPEGGSLSYKWSQTSGPTVSLSSTTVAKPTFTAPTGPTTLGFSLTVASEGRNSTASTVTVEVAAAAGTSNVAPMATATASSEAPEQGAELAIDGVISGYPTNPFAEWSSEGEKAGAWLQLVWSGSYTLDHVVLYDRPNPDDQITSGHLTFSDGSTVAFGALPNSGATGLTVSFPARATTSLKVTVDGVSSTTLNVGLSEIEAWGSPTSAPTANKPSFTSAAAAPFTAGAAGSFQIATAGSPTATLKSSGTLPSGLTFKANADGTATISGTPASSAAPAGSSKSYAITLTATNSSGSATQTLTITVTNNEPKPTKPAFTSAKAASFTTGASGTFTAVTTGVPTATLKSSGTLPSGLTFKANADGTATISGTPASSAAPAGSSKSYAITLTATNSSGSATQTLTITVTNNEPKPTKAVFTTPTTRAATVNKAVEIPIEATGVPMPTLSLSGSAPKGLTFKATAAGKAVLSGTPTTTGTYRLSVLATNSAGTTTHTLTLTVSR